MKLRDWYEEHVRYGQGEYRLKNDTIYQEPDKIVVVYYCTVIATIDKQAGLQLEALHYSVSTTRRHKMLQQIYSNRRVNL